MAVALAVALLPAASAATVVHPGDTIDQPGQYVIDGDHAMKTSGAFVTIEADDVTLDGQGNLIMGNDNGTKAVYVRAADNVTVRNLASTGMYYEDFHFSNVEGSTLENVTAGWSILGHPPDGLIKFTGSNGNRIRDAEARVLSIKGSAHNTVEYSSFRKLGAASSNQNTLRNNRVSGDDFEGLVLVNSHDNLLENNTIEDNPSNGVELSYSHGNVLRNNTVNNTQTGIQLHTIGPAYAGSVGSNNNTLTGNTVTNTDQDGILVSQGTNNTLADNHVQDNAKNGIRLNYSDNNTLRDNGAYQSGNNGISLYDSDHNTLTKNEANANTGDGIDLHNSSDNYIEWNDVFSDYNGIHLHTHSDNNTAISNDVNGMTNNGIQIQDSASNGIYQNTISTGEYGIAVGGQTSGSPHTFIKFNTISSTAKAGVAVVNGGHTNVENNEIKDSSSSGILLSSFDSSVRFNTLENNQHGLTLSGTYNTIEDNQISANSETGITVASSLIFTSARNDVANNTVTGNGGTGVLLRDTDDNAVLGNTVKGNDDGIVLEQSSDNNTLRDNEATNNNGDGVFVTDSTDNTVRGNIVSTNGDTGIHLQTSSRNDVRGNTAQDVTGDGIYLEQSSDNNTLRDNEASSNDGNGIHLHMSSDNEVRNNVGSDNYLYGIYLEQSSTRNHVHHNHLSGDLTGILLIKSGENAIHHNDISENSDEGVRLKNSDDNTVSNNTASTNAVGIELVHSSYNRLADNEASENGDDGISLRDYSNYNILTDNTVSGNDDNGIRLNSSSDDNTVADNEADNNGRGISIEASVDNDLIDNRVEKNTEGIRLLDTEVNDLKRNSVESNDAGIVLNSTLATNLHNNTLRDNGETGIRLLQADDVLIQENTVTGGETGLYIDEDSYPNYLRLNHLGGDNLSVRSDRSSSLTIRDPNYYGPDGPTPDRVTGEFYFEGAFLMDPPGQVNMNDLQEFGYAMKMEPGDVYAFGAPGPLKRNLSDTFHDFQGVVYLYDESTDSWTQATGDEYLGAMDAAMVIPQTEAWAIVDFTDTTPSRPTVRQISEGWNFVAPRAYQGANYGFSTATVPATDLLSPYAEPQDQPHWSRGDDFTTYTFTGYGGGTGVSPFTGYFLYSTGSGDIPGHVLDGATLQETEDALFDAGGGYLD